LIKGDEAGFVKKNKKNPPVPAPHNLRGFRGVGGVIFIYASTISITCTGQMFIAC